MTEHTDVSAYLEEADSPPGPAGEPLVHPDPLGDDPLTLEVRAEA